MDYTTLPGTGLTVSRLCLGAGSFGTQPGWRLDPDEAAAVVDRAIDLGITCFDTANSYATGESEAILGAALNGYNRDRLVVATKVYYGMDPENPNASGLSRKAIDQELTKSLDRLGLDTVDLYQIHRWDYDTPIEETLRALDAAVRRGDVRYIGASSMWASQFADALHTSDRLGLEAFATMQNHYNLVYREEEREMLPFCREHDVGVLAWSPRAKGYLTRPHAQLETTQRGREDDYLRTHSYTDGGGPAVNERVRELADQKGVSMAQLSLAWVLHKEWVDVPIIGTTSIDHLESAVNALDIDLTDSEIDYLEAPYEPVPISGHS